MHTLTNPAEVAQAITATAQEIVFKLIDSCLFTAGVAFAVALLFTVTCLFNRRYPLSIAGFCISGVFALAFAFIPSRDTAARAMIATGKKGVEVITKTINRQNGWTVSKVVEADGKITITFQRPGAGKPTPEEQTLTIPRTVLERNLSRADLSSLSIAPLTPPPL